MLQRPNARTHAGSTPSRTGVGWGPDPQKTVNLPQRLAPIPGQLRCFLHLFIVCVAAVFLSVGSASSFDAIKNIPMEKGRETGAPIPRFVSLKASRARMRVGPSTDYVTSWVYRHKGLPLEITAEYDNWRRVRDCQGTTGWMHASLLSGKRTAMTGPWLDQLTAMRARSSPQGFVLAKLAPKVIVQVAFCDGHWCGVTLPDSGLSGHVRQSTLCGVYPGEVVE